MDAEQLFQQVRAVSENNLSPQNQVDNLIIAMVEMDEDRFERYISSCILRHGFDHTMSRIIYPFLQKVGVLWQTDSINPAQEHFISNLIRQKLIVAIDGTANRQKDDGKQFLLYLPENELHEISLLYANYKIRASGNKSIYLGQSVPYADLKMVYNLHKPDYILTILTCQLMDQSLQDYANRLAADFPDSQILITGAFATQQAIVPAKNILIYSNIDQLSRILSFHD
jgi:hypothetical protein